MIICQMHSLHIKQKGISKYRNCKTMEWKGRNLLNDNFRNLLNDNFRNLLNDNLLRILLIELTL